MISQNKFADDNHAGDNEDLLDQAIVEFLRADAAGQGGDRQQWIDRYPACASGLLEFFDDRERLDRLMLPVRVGRSSSSVGGSSSDSNDDGHQSVRFDTVDFVPSPAHLDAARYRPLRFHARGGMGEIWLAEDKRIGRQVAIKKLRSGREDRKARFMVEAQVTGQLEHPSVVPLHDMGIDDAGELFYVMKFIQGRQLSEAVADYHATKSSADWSNDLTFRRLLETFISVCNAVAYAHSKGVLHRDIKPDNVMLGAYGETLVVDWGLAKVMGQPDEQASTSVRLSGGASTATNDGAIVGSPLYMSPEGAEGHADSVDQFSDVYLLGATLYEILTGKPPREGSSQTELINLARKCRPTGPRKIDGRIPKSLEAICLKAMSFRKVDRYETPLALAEDVQRFLAGEPIIAYREPFLARVGRWVRRHRRGIARGLTLAGILLLAAFAMHSYREANLLATRESARAQLSEFNRLADEAQYFAANTDVISERVPYYDPRRANELGKAALAVAAPWGPQAEQLPLTENRTEFLQTKYALLLLMARTNLLGNQEIDGPHAALTVLDQAKATHELSRGYFELRSRCLTLLGEHKAAKETGDRVHQSETLVTAEDYFLEGERLRLEDLGSSAKLIDDDSNVHRDNLLKAVSEYRQSLQLDPRHYWARFQLGRCQIALGQNSEAVETLSACIAIRPESPWAYTTRGLANVRADHPTEALADLDRAVKMDSEFQPARLNRGVVYWISGNADRAFADFDAVLAAPTEKRLIEAAFYRGQLLLSKQQNREAFAEFSKVIADRPNFAWAHWLRAQTQFRLGNFDAGELDLANYVNSSRGPSSSDTPGQHLLLMGTTLRRIAMELDGPAKSQALSHAAQRLQEAISAGPPNAEAYENLGAVDELLGKTDDAIAVYSKGLGLSADNVKLLNLRGWAFATTNKLEPARADFTTALGYSPQNAEAHAGLGYILALLGSPELARAEASSALLSGAENYLVLHNVACIYGLLSEAVTETKLEHQNLALVTLQRAAKLSRDRISGPNEIALMIHEQAFSDSLRSRPEFKNLINESPLALP